MATKTGRPNLPTPIESNWDWQSKGNCRKALNPEIFYLPDHMRGQLKEKRIQMAKAICTECPVQQECLEHALSVPEIYGVWGGKSEEELAELVRARKLAERRERRRASNQ